MDYVYFGIIIIKIEKIIQKEKMFIQFRLVQISLSIGGIYLKIVHNKIIYRKINICKNNF